MILKRIVLKLRKLFLLLFWKLAKYVPFTRKIYETRMTRTPITFSMWVIQKIIGINRKAYWPIHFTSKVIKPKNVYCGIETCPGYMPNCYIQAEDKIYIGDYTAVGPNVGLISTNHDIYDNRKHVLRRPIEIGKYCWLGMNSVVLPGVRLGDFTIVAAGSIVSKSFKDGYCVIGGNPAQLLYKIDRKKCIRYKSLNEYHGYMRKSKFVKFRKKHLNV